MSTPRPWIARTFRTMLFVGACLVGGPLHQAAAETFILWEAWEDYTGTRPPPTHWFRYRFVEAFETPLPDRSIPFPTPQGWTITDPGAPTREGAPRTTAKAQCEDTRKALQGRTKHALLCVPGHIQPSQWKLVPSDLVAPDLVAPAP